MPNVLVRGVPEEVVETLKHRAAAHRRSLQQEMLEILQEAAERPDGMTAAELARCIRERLSGAGISFSDSTPLIRSDRDR